MKIRYAALALLVLCLTACGNKTPQCSDEKTVELVKRIFHNSLTEKQNEPGEDASLLEKMKQDVKLVVGTIRTAATDEKIGKVTCDAVLEAALPPAAKAPLENPIFRNAMQRDPATRDLKVNGVVVSTEIQYTSQMTDDKKEHLVEMRGFKGVVDLVSALGNMGVFKSAGAAPTTPDAATKPSASKVNWSSFLGQSASVALSDAVVGNQFKALLGDKYPVFQTNMEVAGELHAEDGNLIVGSGNAPHDGGTNEAMFAVNTATGKYYAVLFTDGKTFNAFGVANMRELPAPLLQWFQDKGGKL